MEPDIAAAGLSYGSEDPDYEDQPLETTNKTKPKRKSAAGRTLTRWDASKDQFVLLCVGHVVSRDRVPLDWQEVAKLVDPEGNLTGDAIKQHLVKIRAAREAAGPEYPVPPKIVKKQSQQQSVPGSIANKTATRQTPIVEQQPSIEPEREPEAAFKVPSKKSNSALLYHTPETKSKPSSMKAHNRSSLVDDPSKKRKLNTSENDDLAFGTEDDRANSLDAKPRVVIRSAAPSKKKKNRRANLPSNFPDVNPVPSLYSPLASTLANDSSDLRTETGNFGSVDMSFPAQSHLDYTEGQIGDFTEGGRSSSQFFSPANYTQDFGMGYQQSHPGTTLDQSQPGMQSFAPPGQDYFPAVTSFDNSSNGLPYAQHQDMVGGEQPAEMQESDIFMPHGMTMEMDGEGQGQDIGGGYGSMEGVGMGGDPGAFQMEPYAQSTVPQSEDWLGVGLWDDLFGGDYELFGGEGGQGDGPQF